MNKIKFAIIGNGYRAMIFLDIALALPEHFEVTSVLFRNPKKAEEFSKRYHIPTALTIDECLSTKPDFVVIVIDRGANAEMMTRLMPYNIPMLVETPPAITYDDLISLWNHAEMHKARIQISEQYFLHPLYQAKLKVLGENILGQLSNLSISWAHDYHGVSLIRKLLNVGFETAKIYGKDYNFPVTITDSRDGIKTSGEVTMANRARYTFEFESGKVAFYDFAGSSQYRSKIRTRHLNIQGSRGEMDNLTVRSLTEDHQPTIQTFELTKDINTLSTYSVNLGNKCLYSNPLVHARLTDDEIAIANCLLGMDQYIKTGQDFYSFAEGCQDTYFFILMQEALKQPNIPIQTKIQPWNQ